MTLTAFQPRPALAQAPALTLPPKAAEAVRSAYGGAQVILEYGSGGSTALAAAMPGKTVFSVESDKDWMDGLAAWFSANPPAARVMLHHGDVGPTGEWGMPTDRQAVEKFPGYALSVWDRPDFRHPDVVLVDGRFRVACFLTTLFRIGRPVTLLWDDYGKREAYHAVERYALPVAMHGRMARFDLMPMALPSADLSWIIAQFLHSK